MARNKAFDPEERLEKARDLFWEKGYHATSMQDLVDTMQLNRGSIYDTYGDKHALFLQCLNNYAAEKLAEYKKAATKARSPMQAVEKIIRKAVTRALEDGKSCMVVKSCFELAETDQSVCKILRGEGETLTSVFEDLLIQAMEAGEISADKDPHLLAHFIVANFAGFWQTNISCSQPGLVNKMADYLIEAVKK
jgi:TetR/AcrR family transcriptional repressor of nem operon